jgi:hypothetical protein
MSELGFEPTITVSRRAKTLHVLDRSATVTGCKLLVALKYPPPPKFDGYSAQHKISVEDNCKPPWSCDVCLVERE